MVYADFFDFIRIIIRFLEIQDLFWKVFFFYRLRKKHKQTLVYIMDGRWKRLIRRCTAISCLTQHHAVLFTVLLLLGLVNEITDAIINKRSFGLKINHKQHRCDLQLKADSYLNLVRIRSAWGLAWRIQCRCQMLFFFVGRKLQLPHGGAGTPTGNLKCITLHSK